YVCAATILHCHLHSKTTVLKCLCVVHQPATQPESRWVRGKAEPSRAIPWIVKAESPLYPATQPESRWVPAESFFYVFIPPPPPNPDSSEFFIYICLIYFLIPNYVMCFLGFSVV
ncbi:hypothetical protein L9F63_024776, partial [Diploptera punctata]